MSSLKKLAGQTAIYGISSILGRFVNWGLTPLYTNYFTEGDVGVLTDLYAYTTYFLVILTFGMETAFFRFTMDKKDFQEPYRHSFIFVTGMGVLFFMLVGLNYQLFARILDYEHHPGLILMVAGVILLDVLSALPMAKLRFEEKAKKFAKISLISIFLNVILSIIFILGMGLGVEYVFVANLIASAVRLGLSLPGAMPDSWSLNNMQLRSMAGFGFYIMLAGLLGMMNQNVEKNMIPHLWPECQEYLGEERSGLAMLGLYSAGYKLAMIILLATQAFRYAAEPFFFRHAQEKGSRIIFARVFHYYWLVSMGTFVFVSTFTYQIARFFIGESFWPGLNVVPILLISYSLLGAYTNFSIWFKLTKQTRFGILFSGVGALVVIVLNLLTIPWFGYVGSAWASVASLLVMCWLVYRSGQHYYNIPYRLDRALLYLAIALAFYGLITFLDPGFLGRVVLVLMFCGVCVGIEKYMPVVWKDSARGTKEKPEGPSEKKGNVVRGDGGDMPMGE